MYKKRRGYINEYSIVISFYLVVAICNYFFYFLIDLTGISFLLEGNINFELWPFFYIVFCLVLLSRPYFSQNVIHFSDNWKMMRIISRTFIICSIINFCLLSSQMINILQSGDWNSVYTESQEHEAQYNNIIEHLVMVYCYYMKIPATIILFANIVKGRIRKEDVLLALSILLCIVSSTTTSASRASLFIGVMILVLCYCFFKNDINPDINRSIKKYSLLGGGVLLFLLLSITLVRYSDGRAAASLLYYFGHSMIVFGYGVVDTIKNFGYGAFFCRSVLDYIPGDLELGTHCDRLFTTIVGSLYKDFGPAFTPIVCFMFSTLIMKLTKLNTARGKVVTMDLAQATVYFFFLNELLIGAFYMSTSILNWIMIFAIYALMKVLKTIIK